MCMAVEGHFIDEVVLCAVNQIWSKISPKLHILRSKMSSRSAGAKLYDAVSRILNTKSA